MRSSAACFVLLLLGSGARAGVLNVPADFPTVQSAIVAAQDGDQILVQPGLYHETLDTLGKSVTLTGAGGAGVTTLDAAGLDGSVVLAIEGAPVIEGFTITGGKGHVLGSSRLGGGLFLQQTGVGAEVRQCRITGNDVLSGGPGSNGGGACVFVGALVFSDCDFVDNHAVNNGGGLYGGVALDCRFEGNSAAVGGGYYNGGSAGGSPRRCTFTGNHAVDSAGGCYVFNDAISLLSNCTFAGNAAGVTASAAIVYGLGVPYQGGIAENCVFAGNTGGDGVSLLFTQNAVFSWKLVTGCTFVGDQADGRIFDRCIFQDGAAPAVAAATVSSSDIEGGWTGPSFANIDADPLFVAPALGDYHLQPGSPCFNAGGSSGIGGDETDMDGQPRMQGGATEMGADEITEDCNGNGVADYVDLASGTSLDTDGDGVPDECAGTFTDLGHALAGGNGVPLLTGYGSLLATHPAYMALQHAKKNGSATLVIGAAQVNVPFKGGVFVPAAQVLAVGLPITGAGILQLTALWPAGIPSGFSIYFQFWIADGAGPHGFAASNGLSATMP